MKKSKVSKAHRYSVTFLETWEVEYFYFAESADEAIELFLSEHPNVDNDVIILCDFGVQKDPDDRA